MRIDKNKPKKLAVALAILLCGSLIPMEAFAEEYTPPIGGGESTITVTDKNGVKTTYTDIYKDSPDRRKNIKDQNRFFLDALTMGDNAPYQDWLSLAYNILKANPDSYDDFHKGNGDAYDENKYGKDFDKYFGGGDPDGEISISFYHDLRKPANNIKEDKKSNRKSVVFGFANSLDEVQEMAYRTLNDTLHNRWNTSTFRKHNEIEEFTEHKEIEGPVIYSLVSNLTDTAKEMRYNTMGLAFYDFELVPVIDDKEFVNGASGMTPEEAINSQDSNPYFSYTDVDSGKVEPTVFRNEGYVPSSNTVEVGTTETVSEINTWENTQQYSFEEAIGGETKFNIKIPFLGLGEQTLSANFTAGQVLSTAEGGSKEVSKSIDNRKASQVEVPAHALVEVTTQEDKVLTDIKYDCPVAVKYKVAVFSYYGTLYDDNMLIKNMESYDQHNFVTFFGESQDSTTAVDNLYNRIHNADLTGYDNSNSITSIHCKEKNMDLIKGLSWKKIKQLHGLYPTQIMAQNSCDRLIGVQPMSVEGASIHQDYERSVIKSSSPVPLYPLKVVKRPVYQRDIDLKVGESAFTSNIYLEGRNEYDIEYAGFTRFGGQFQLEDEKPAMAGRPVVLAENDAQGAITKITANAPGTVYLKYYIDEDIYMDDRTKRYSKNSDLKSTEMVKVTVTGNPVECTVIAVGSATAFVGDAPVDIGEISTIEVGIYDTDDCEMPGQVVWGARELPEKGILVENNMLSVSKPGVFHIRASYEGNDSEWLTVTALNPEAEAIPIEASGIDFDFFEEPAAPETEEQNTESQDGEAQNVEEQEPDEQENESANISRSSYVTFLGKMTELIVGVAAPETQSQTFSDVDYGEDYARYVEYAAALGLAVGDGKGNFNPNDRLTATDMATLTERYASILGRMLPDNFSMTLDESTKEIMIQWAENTADIFGMENVILNRANTSLQERESAGKSDILWFVEQLAQNINQI